MVFVAVVVVFCGFFVLVIVSVCGLSVMYHINLRLVGFSAFCLLVYIMVKIILFLRVLHVYASNTSGKVILRHIKYELYFFLNLVPTHYCILKLVELMT